MKYIYKKVLETDSETGLDKEIRVVKINIDAETEEIVVFYAIVLASPTGVVMKTLEVSSYKRYNKAAVLDENNVEVAPANMAYNNLKASAIGQGIVAIVTSTIADYPNLTQA